MTAIHLADRLLDLISQAARKADDTRWTACGLRADPDFPRLAIVADLSLVTCGNCRRSRDIPERNAVVARWGTS